MNSDADGLAIIAIVHGVDAANSLRDLLADGGEDAEFARRLIAAALRPEFVIEKLRAAHDQGYRRHWRL